MNAPKFPEMQMKVSVDMFYPTIQGIQQNVLSVWARVPPPVQTASPYAIAAILSAAVVHKVSSRARRKMQHDMARQIAALEKQRQEMEARIEHLSNRSAFDEPGVAALSKAIAEATTAAAAAASAAADAARVCAVPKRA